MKSSYPRMSPIYLTDEQYKFIDALIFNLKKRGYRGASRNSFIKALVQVEFDKKRKYDSISDEEELINLLKI